MIDPSQMQAMQEMLAPAAGGPPPMAPPTEGAIPMGGPVMAAQPEAEPKAPPLLLPPSLGRQLAEGYVEQVKQMSQLFADHAGYPDDYKRYPVKAQVNAWFLRDPRQDPLTLKQQGLSPVEIRDKVYPLRRVLLKMAGPRPEDRVKFVAQMKAERARAATVDEGAPPR